MGMALRGLGSSSAGAHGTLFADEVLSDFFTIGCARTSHSRR